MRKPADGRMLANQRLEDANDIVQQELELILFREQEHINRIYKLEEQVKELERKHKDLLDASLNKCLGYQR